MVIETIHNVHTQVVTCNEFQMSSCRLARSACIRLLMLAVAVIVGAVVHKSQRGKNRVRFVKSINLNRFWLQTQKLHSTVKNNYACMLSGMLKRVDKKKKKKRAKETEGEKN